MKKAFSLLLSFTLLIMIPGSVLADSELQNEEPISAWSFMDAEGKENTAYMYQSPGGSIRVEYFIEGVPINIAEGSYKEGDELYHINLYDVTDESTEEYTINMPEGWDQSPQTEPLYSGTYYPTDSSGEILSDNDEKVSPDPVTYSFIDAEGKLNTSVIYFSSEDRVFVEYYIENELINTAEASVFAESNILNIKLNDIVRGTEETCELKLSDLVSTENIMYANAGGDWYYNGHLDYKTVYTGWDASYDCVLHIFQKYLGYGYSSIQINHPMQTAVSLIISAVAAVLQYYVPALAVFASDAVHSALYACGVSVVDGVITSILSSSCSIISYNHNISAHAWENSTYLNTYNVYSGSCCYLLYADGGHSSYPIYQDYLGWATQPWYYYMFCNAFSWQYPGLASYTVLHY